MQGNDDVIILNDLNNSGKDLEQSDNKNNSEKNNTERNNTEKNNTSLWQQSPCSDPEC